MTETPIITVAIMTVTTFYDFSFRAHHSLGARSQAAASDHWHSYSVRFYFTGAPDQDALSAEIESFYADLHGTNLNDAMEIETTDENLATQFLKTWAPKGCVRVIVTNDGRRGAEAML